MNVRSHSEWSKQRQRQISYDGIHIQKSNMTEMNIWNRLTAMGSRLEVAWGRSGRRRDWEFGVSRFKVLYRRDKQQDALFTAQNFSFSITQQTTVEKIFLWCCMCAHRGSRHAAANNYAWKQNLKTHSIWKNTNSLLASSQVSLWEFFLHTLKCALKKTVLLCHNFLLCWQTSFS